MMKSINKWRKAFCLLPAMVLNLAALQAQPADTTWTLKEVVEYAMQGNTDIKKQNLELLKTKYHIQEYRSDALPQLNGSMSYSNNPLLAKQLLPGEFFGQPGTLIPVQFGVKNVINGNVQLSQQLINFQYKAGLAAAEQAMELTRANEKYTREDVIYTIATAYYQSLITGKQIKIVEANLDRVNTGLKIAQVQFDNKIIRRIDLDQYKVNQVNLLTDLGNAQLNYELQVEALKIYMGYPLDSSLVISDEVDEEAIFQAENSVKNNPALALLKTQAELKTTEIRNIRAGYYPKISASANYGFNSQFNKLGKGNVNNFGNAAVGLNISIPIFDGFRKQRQVQQRSMELKSLQLDQELTERQLTLQYSNALKTYAQNKKNYDAQKANLELAENVYHAMNNNYKLGISNLTELNNTEVSLKEAQTKYLTALLQMKLTELDILKVNGSMDRLLN